MTGRAIILRGDARNIPLADNTVDLIVTSPPYWGLRSYTDGGQHYASQIGDEPNPHAYIDNLLDCTQEWIRILKPSGSIWVNLGDSYANTATPERHGSSDGATSRGDRPGRRTSTGTGIRPKSLYGLPWRYALACVDKLGLILRRDQIWHKTTALPESVTDRCRSSHEYLFHFTVRERYFAAVDEIRQPSSGYERPNGARRTTPGGQRPRAMADTCNPLGPLPGSVWPIAGEPLVVPEHVGVGHYAAFPTELPNRIIRGWSPTGWCTACRRPRRPHFTAAKVEDRKGRKQHVTDLALDKAHGSDGRGGTRWRQEGVIRGYVCDCTPYTDHVGSGERHPNVTGPKGNHRPDGDGPEARPSNLGAAQRVGPRREYHLDRWTPAATTPSVVVDPFGGTGTTALVAACLGRTGISIDRSADYCRLATWRITDPRQRAKVLQLPKPAVQADGQLDLFGGAA